MGLWKNNTRSKIYVTGDPKGDTKECGARKIIEEK